MTSANVELETWKLEVSKKIDEMIKDWEQRIPEDEDDTLYSLALRRAQDVVLGHIVDLGP
jgi:hypothetical protein